MSESDVLMHEQRSRLSILVIEDTQEYGMNALEGVKGHTVTLYTTLEQVKHASTEIELGRRKKFDFILSDVNFPSREGEGPESNIAAVLDMAYKSDTPVCFVTKADHHGLLEAGDEGTVALVAVTMDGIASTYLSTSRAGQKADEAELFRKLEASKRETVKSGSKTPEIWGRALQMVQNAATTTSCIGAAIRKVRELGLGVTFEKGMPRVLPSKIKR